jgi:hypothetical protein
LRWVTGSTWNYSHMSNTQLWSAQCKS